MVVLLRVVLMVSSPPTPAENVAVVRVLVAERARSVLLVVPGPGIKFCINQLIKII
jgi:hypothetical protein